MEVTNFFFSSFSVYAVNLATHRYTHLAPDFAFRAHFTPRAMKNLMLYQKRILSHNKNEVT